METGKTARQSPGVPAQENLFTENKILTVENVASLLSVSTKTVYKLVECGTIPYKDLNQSSNRNKKRKRKCIRFLLSELTSWMKGKDYV
jgi:predicted DNA-binding transcriptional regulator AlpA